MRKKSHLIKRKKSAYADFFYSKTRSNPIGFNDCMPGLNSMIVGYLANSCEITENLWMRLVLAVVHTPPGQVSQPMTFAPPNGCPLVI